MADTPATPPSRYVMQTYGRTVEVPRLGQTFAYGDVIEGLTEPEVDWFRNVARIRLEPFVEPAPPAPAPAAAPQPATPPARGK